MAKITVHGGASDQTLPLPEPTGPAPAAGDEQAPAEVAEVADQQAEENANRPEEVPAGFDDLTVPELRERLRAAGLPVSGNRDELLARLMAHEAGP